MTPSPTDPRRLHRLALLLTFGGAIGLLAAATLLVEKIAIIKDPEYIPSCSINPVLSCGSVMTTPQAEAFGFPNPIVGVAAFAVVLTTGVVLLAGASLRRWYWLGLQIGATFGIVFVHWLMFQSLYRIDALCPYCMVVWTVTIPIFLYTTLFNLRCGNISVPDRVERLIVAVDNTRGVVLTAWYLIVVALIAQRFWDYWETLLP